MNSHDLLAIETRWEVKLPSNFASIYAQEWDAIHRPDASIFSFALPALEPDKIINAKETVEEWDIPRHLLPFAGDFHDLLCLDYRSSKNPSVVYLNDSREIISLCNNFQTFLDSIFLKPESLDNPDDGIDRDKSWLDF
ncbi:MAG: SMI1/KNR4 family protein [Planctomycetota bacterium]